jgi:uncharacterized membrane protein (UPF0127 family)
VIVLAALASLGWFGAAATVTPGRVDWAVAVFPSGAEFKLEIASDPAARRLGYMFRERVAPDEGMLFLFDGPGRHSIWMKNCEVDLDVIWLDATWHVVEIAHRLTPCPENGDCPGFAPMRTASYVLEVAGGAASEHGLKIGDRIDIRSEPPLVP